MENATFFTPFDPAHVTRIVEHLTLFPLFGGGTWTRDYILTWFGIVSYPDHWFPA